VESVKIMFRNLSEFLKIERILLELTFEIPVFAC
jgi:hypothetical protein